MELLLEHGVLFGDGLEVGLQVLHAALQVVQLVLEFGHSLALHGSSLLNLSVDLGFLRLELFVLRPQIVESVFQSVNIFKLSVFIKFVINHLIQEVAKYFVFFKHFLLD